MKFLAVLGVLLIQCAATKSWNNDSYSEETFSVFSWLGYLKRLSIIVLMFSGVVLYYVPESRPHARRMCYALIDFTANGLKSALSARDGEYMYEKIKSKYHRAKYEQLVAQKRQSREIQEDGVNFERAQCRSKKSKAFIGDDELLGGREKNKMSVKQSKEHRQSRHRHRNGVIKNSSCMEITKPIYFYSDKLDDLQKYVKSNLNGVKRANVDNYALVISGSPQQMALLDQNYEKDDVVIVQDPYLRAEYKECGTSTDKLPSKGDASSSEQEGPTRDHNDHATESSVSEHGDHQDAEKDSRRGD
ncbi:uncharacterized protein LOC143369490 isoform X2 [Andrena cerasifolii]|uniref:uncharacterized protein LOC143369490 isoform X2 n=1 Tax=Andrena cerasifolii TaxID=2819439 RepID=UPI004037DC0A